MITTRISENIPCHSVLESVNQAILLGAQSIEMDVYSYGNHKLIACKNIKWQEEFNYAEEIIYLDFLLEFIKQKNEKTEILLNLKKPLLENRAKAVVDKCELRKQVRYCGEVHPDYLSLWDRQYIHYNVENCLPNVTRLGELKRTHFDVIHYFCVKYKVKTIRIHVDLCSENLICWSNSENLQLEVYGVSTKDDFKRLVDMGVQRVVQSNWDVIDKVI